MSPKEVIKKLEALKKRKIPYSESTDPRNVLIDIALDKCIDEINRILPVKSL